LSPLNLTQTTVGGIPAGAARGYRDGQPVKPLEMDAMPGTGDIWSTASDLTRFTAALHSGQLVSASSLRAMCTAHAALDDSDEGEPRLITTGYGYGMYIGVFAGRGLVPQRRRPRLSIRGLLDPGGGGQHRHLAQRRRRQHD
jgi:CubicO group peptidase (beta-lactamase class C family)